MSAEEKKKHLRPVRSYVLREGRMTKGQTRAMEELWPLYGLNMEAGVQQDFSKTFGNHAPVVFEIGFGDGGALAALAVKNPDQNFVGVEVHKPGVGSLLLKLEEQNLTNVRVYKDDAVQVLHHSIGAGTLDRVHLFFPDPWHKKRHNKRRILSESFIDLLAEKIKPGGVFHFASDWQDYAEQALEKLNAHAGFRNQSRDHSYSSRPSWRPETKFERRGLRLGHGVWDILLDRV